MKDLSPPEPLTFQRVYRASHAAGSLFRWCTTTIVDALADDEIVFSSPSTAREASTAAPENDDLEVTESPAPEPAEDKSMQRSKVPERPPSPPEPVEDRSVKLPPIVGEPPAPRQAQTSQRSQMPAWTPLPKPKEAPRRERPEAWKPDRHFELPVDFELGYGGITGAGEASMQTVAATICMRPRLKLELITVPDRIEHEALAASRMTAAHDFFCVNGVRPSLSEEVRTAKQGDDPSVACCLLLDNDPELGQYLKQKEDPNPEEDFKPSRQLLYIVDWIEDNFRLVKH